MKAIKDKDKNGENASHLEITEVGLIHYNIVNNNHQQNSRVLNAFGPNKSLGQLLDTSPKFEFFKKLLIQNFHILNYGLLVKTLHS